MELWELVARERVRDTVATYSHAGDRFRIEELANCFTPDGVLEVKSWGPARGRAEIIRMLTGGRAADAAPSGDGRRRDQDGAPRRWFVRHFVTNLRFDLVTPERIETSAYFLVLTPDGPDHWGRYRDVLVPHGEQWLFAHRRAAMESAVRGSYTNPDKNAAAEQS